jgi:arylamine N-acetyltransferase
VQLPLLFQPALRGGGYDVEALAARVKRRRCPACETERGRARCGGTAPAVWFDTELGDWVVALPAGGESGVLLPLEIHWFDAPEALVYRTASDIVHSGDVFESP